jgi:hypothetical protein
MSAFRRVFRISSCLLFGLAAVAAVSCRRGEPDPGAPPPRRRFETVELVERPAFPFAVHLEASDIAAGKVSFRELFEQGRDLFHAAYNGLDGVGIGRLPDGTPVHRFSLQPLGFAPLAPSSQSCGGCHNMPVAAAAGLSQTNLLNDPNVDGVGPFNLRSTTSLHGDGLLQLLSQEITEELQGIRTEAVEAARAQAGTAVRLPLQSKGVSYGEIVAVSDASGEVVLDLGDVVGVDPDLVVRPLAWKGTVPTVRALVSAAASIAMGMQAEEFVWLRQGADGSLDLDGDGVERELSVGDVTALTVYTAAQETPQELERLATWGWVAAPSPAQEEQVERGRAAFAEVGCATCHVPQLELENTVFEEPTARGNGAYYDASLVERGAGYDLERPFRFDLLTDPHEPRVEPRDGGGAIVRLYGDLKRHAMGRALADPGGPTASITPEVVPLQHEGKVVLVSADVFLTAELWGVGNTGPWLHDGRAGSLREAVALHGEDAPVAVGEPGRSEAQEARDAFLALPEAGQTDLVAFLLSLRTFSAAPGPPGPPRPPRP